MSINLHVYVYTCYSLSLFFFFNDTATTEIYTLSLHDALPISASGIQACGASRQALKMKKCSVFPEPSKNYATIHPIAANDVVECQASVDRKSTRLNSSHLVISYAVFCLKKKNKHLAAVPPQTSPSTTFSCY